MDDKNITDISMTRRNTRKKLYKPGQITRVTILDVEDSQRKQRERGKKMSPEHGKNGKYDCEQKIRTK